MNCGDASYQSPWRCSPKTIDNDIPIVDRTFGFQTAVEEARRAIDAANVEAEGFPMGLAVVKLMGRNSGFISMYASLGARVVDLCLVPEVVSSAQNLPASGALSLWLTPHSSL